MTEGESYVRLAGSASVMPEHVPRRWPLRTLGVALAAGFGAWIGLQLEPFADDPVVERRASPAPPATTGRQAIELDSDPKDARLGTDSSISAETLSLVLVATQPSSNVSEGTAALGTDARNPQVYRVGSLLENGARLAEVHADRVVLERAGERATLYKSGALRFVRRIVNPLSRDALKPAGVQDAAAEELLQVGKQGTGRRTRPVVESAVAQALVAQPHFEAEKLAGFEVRPGQHWQTFEALGLAAGDVIRFVNGELITKEAQWTQIMGPLQQGESVNVTVVREGALLHLTLDGSAFESTPGTTR